MFLEATVPEVVPQQGQHGVRWLGEPQLYGGNVPMAAQARAEHHLHQFVRQVDVLRIQDAWLLFKGSVGVG